MGRVSCCIGENYSGFILSSIGISSRENDCLPYEAFYEYRGC